MDWTALGQMSRLHGAVGAVFDEFQRSLAEWKERYRDDPRRELQELALLALEREELVAVSYRASLLGQRVDALDASPEVKELVRSALLWLWRDEEAHSVYIRGVLLRVGGLGLALRTLMQQVAGGVGGWAASVQQHLTWRQAPFARFFAALVTLIGVLADKIPESVRSELRHQSFRDFCEFNVDAELTAKLAWSRFLELCEESRLDAELAAAARVMRDDEDRHKRVFELFSRAFSKQGKFVLESAALLRSELEAINPLFLPPRPARASDARVFVRSGDSVDQALDQVIDDLEIERAIAERGDAAKLRVAVKTTFMMGYHRDDPSTLINPELLRRLVERLRALGIRDIRVLDGPNLYDRFYEHRDVKSVARYFDLEDDDWVVADTSEELVSHEYSRGLGTGRVAKSWAEADIRILLGRLRSHSTEGVFLSLSAVEGLSARSDEFLFADRQAHWWMPMLMVLDDFPPHYTLLDAWTNLPHGLGGVIGDRSPVDAKRVYGARSAVALDLVAARHVHLNGWRRSTLIKAACEWFGDPRDRIEVVGEDSTIAAWRGTDRSAVSRLLSFLSYPVYQFLSGRGRCFLPSTDTRAFPEKEPSGTGMRALRWLGRRLLGLPELRV